MKNLLIILGCLLIAACDSGNDTSDGEQYLPWKISVFDGGHTQVLGVTPGIVTLKEFTLHFQELADVRLFEKPSGDLFLEAYLGKTRIGKLEARLVAELDAPESLLKSILASNNGRKATPNNYWQYALDDEQLRQALDLTIWRFMYIPIAHYEQKQIEYFGTPDAVEQATASAEYRFYSKKGVVVLWDKEGKETFYYSSPKAFERLKQALIADKKSDTPFSSQKDAAQ